MLPSISTSAEKLNNVAASETKTFLPRGASVEAKAGAYANAAGAKADRGGKIYVDASTHYGDIHHHYPAAHENKVEEKLLNFEGREELRKMHFSVPPVAEYFVPTRHSEKLKQLFEAGATKVAITGIAGSGKTELAKYYAHSLNAATVSEGKAVAEEAKSTSIIAATVFYLEADPAALETSLWHLAKVLNLPLRMDKETCAEYFKRVVREHGRSSIPKVFSAYPNALLILNNASNYTGISYLLDVLQDASIKLLITTQQHGFFTATKFIHNLDIGIGMSASEGAKLLKGIVPGLELDGVEAFIHEVDGLPLVLSLVGLYMRREKLKNIKIYQKQVESVSERLRLEIAGLAGKTRYECALHTVLASVIEKISASSDAFELLVFASIVHPEGIPEVFFRDYLKTQKIEDKSTLSSVEERLYASIKLIEAYGLLKSHSGSLDARQYSMHRVVQAEVRGYYKTKITVSNGVASSSTVRLGEVKESKESLHSTALPKPLGRILTVINQNLPPQLLEFPLQVAPLILHLESALVYVEQLLGAVKTEAVGITYHTLGMARQQQGGTDNLINALNCCQKALAIDQALGEQNTADTATLLNSLGNVHYHLGSRANLEQAHDYYEQALNLRRTFLGEQHPNTASSLNSLGVLYADLGGCENLEKARAYVEQALKIQQAVLGQRHSDVATSLNNLGTVHSTIGGREHLEKARDCLEQALKMKRTLLGEQHPNTTSSLCNLGTVHSKLASHEDLEKARVYHEQALKIRKAVLGEQHSDVALSLNNLGTVHFKLASHEDLEKARVYHEQALKIRKAVLGEQHPDVATSLYNLSFVYYKLGGKINLQQGLDYCKQALAIQEQQLGSEHPNTINAHNNLTLIQARLNALQSFQLKTAFAASLTAVGFFATGGIGGVAVGAVVGISTPAVIEKARSCCRRPKRD